MTSGHPPFDHVSATLVAGPMAPTSALRGVSVIVPSYNGAAHILECLASIVAQTHADWQCIVVDDGSTDDTGELVTRQADPRIRLLRQDNAGVSTARNHGLSLAEAPYAMFLDGDDILHPAALSRLVAALETDRAAVAAFGTFRKILPDGGPFPGEKPLARHSYPSGDVLEAMLGHNFLANGGHVLVRTAAAKAIGGFDATLRLSEDWEFWCRLAARGEFCFIGTEPEIFALRVHPGSSSGGLSVDFANHEPSIAAVTGNPAIRERFDDAAWSRLVGSMRASAMWEAGRVNFTVRRFDRAWPLMIGALRLDPQPKRLALLAAAIASRATGRAWHSRLRFRDSDANVSASAAKRPH